MKNSFRFFQALSLFFFLSILLSCEQEKVEPAFSFEDFRQEIEAKAPYAEFMKAQHTFFSQLKNHEIDLFGIMHELEDRGVEDFCSIDVSILSPYDGGQKFIDGFCGMHSNMKALRATTPELSLLSEGQYLTLFKDGTINEDPNAVSSRVENCLDNFQNKMVDIWNSCENHPVPSNPYTLEDSYYEDRYLELCVRAGASLATFAYEYCCDQGGDGCP